MFRHKECWDWTRKNPGKYATKFFENIYNDLGGGKGSGKVFGELATKHPVFAEACIGRCVAASWVKAGGKCFVCPLTALRSLPPLEPALVVSSPGPRGSERTPSGETPDGAPVHVGSNGRRQGKPGSPAPRSTRGRTDAVRGNPGVRRAGPRGVGRTRESGAQVHVGQTDAVHGNPGRRPLCSGPKCKMRFLQLIS